MPTRFPRRSILFSIPTKILPPFPQRYSNLVLPTDPPPPTPALDNFPGKIASSFNFPETIAPEPSWVVPSQDEVLDTLLRHKGDPASALRFFKGIERQRVFVKTADVLCLLLQILASCPNTHGDAKYLLNSYVFGDSAPVAKVLVEMLVECAGR
ncbi:uncharacterized protein LOC109802585 [Cajanus cajan]|nr:uncharacterized protein LOC109802585 [Cajanus cajan]